MFKVFARDDVYVINRITFEFDELALTTITMQISKIIIIFNIDSNLTQFKFDEDLTQFNQNLIQFNDSNLIQFDYNLTEHKSFLNMLLTLSVITNSNEISKFFDEHHFKCFIEKFNVDVEFEIKDTALFKKHNLYEFDIDVLII